MKILAIETATESCSAALNLDGEIHEIARIAPRDHANLILSFCDELLAAAELRLADMDAVAFGRGPGSFTGVRIATGVIQGIAYAIDRPVIPVSSLAALAYSAFREEGAQQVLPAIDARMGEVYWAAYRLSEGQAESVITERVCPPDTVLMPEEGSWFGVGTGWGTYEALLTRVAGDRLTGHAADRYPLAGDVARLAPAIHAAGHAVDAADARPLYLRDDVAEKPTPKS